MSRASRRRTIALLLCRSLMGAALLLGGCGDEIGDSCSTNIDCATNGTRICDLTQQNGYCTVRNCVADNCPNDSVCVNFFTTNMLEHTCDVRREDVVLPGASATDDCTPDEVCLVSGYCALPSLGQRYCMKSCKHDGDCREGYRCLTTGTQGAEPMIDPSHPDRQSFRYCGQAPLTEPSL